MMFRKKRPPAKGISHDGEQRLLLLIDSIPDLIWVARGDGTGLFSNRQMLDYLGRSLEQIRDQGWLESVHPDDRGRVSEAWNHAVRAAGEYCLEMRLRNGRTGGYRWFLTRAVPYRDQVRILLWFGTCTDIHDHKQIEASLRESDERFRTALESLPGGVFAHDLEGRFLMVNEASVKNTGYTRQELLSMSVQDIDPSSVARDDRIRLWHTIHEGAPVIIESTHIRKDGSTYPAEVHINAVRMDGRPVILGFAFDISERKRVQQQLLQLNETLEQQVNERTQLAENRARQLQALAVELIEAEERTRRQFADLLHDDLQQMLAAARMQVQEVAERLASEPLLLSAERLLEESIGKSRRLSHELSPAVLHRSGLIAGLNWLCGQMNEQFGLEAELDTDTDLVLESTPLTVFVFRAAQELLFNIVKHAGVKSARVSLALSEGSLAIAVSDQGRGFDPELLNRPLPENGFGLMTIQERARYMGGDFAVESAAGKGSRLTLTVPVNLTREGARPPAAAGRPPLKRDPSACGDSGPLRILFADDHKVVRQGLVQMTASHLNLQVVGEAANGQEAVEKALRLRPDVIVMDVSMPVMDGIEATRRIKAELPDVRVIGLSVHEENHMARRMREAGADSFLNKTVSSSKLLGAIYGSPP